MSADQNQSPIDGILENVARLLDDTNYLIADGRTASAFVLAVIALEEVGKIIHERWKALGFKVTPQGRNYHLQKQWAVASLLSTDSIFDKMVEESDKQEGDIDAIADLFIDSTQRKFLESIADRRLDRAKQLGLYWDEGNAAAGRTPDHLTLDGVEYIRQQIIDALALMHDNARLMVAHLFYEAAPKLTLLGRRS